MGQRGELQARLIALLRALGAKVAPAPLAKALVLMYALPNRRYHSLAHLDECLAQLDETRELAREPLLVELGLFFHDALYDTKKHDNELRSAEWARTIVAALAIDARVGERVAELVLCTKHDAVPDDPDARLLADIDLSILGREPRVFDEYERQIREEYAWVEDGTFRTKRAEILRAFLARPRIYSTARFFERYEAQARANLARSLRALES